MQSKITYEVPLVGAQGPEDTILKSGRSDLKFPSLVWLFNKKTDTGFQVASGVVERSVALRLKDRWQTPDVFISVVPCIALLPYEGVQLPKFK